MSLPPHSPPHIKTLPSLCLGSNTLCQIAITSPDSSPSLSEFSALYLAQIPSSPCPGSDTLCPPQAQTPCAGLPASPLPTQTSLIPLGAPAPLGIDSTFNPTSPSSSNTPGHADLFRCPLHLLLALTPFFRPLFSADGLLTPLGLSHSVRWSSCEDTCLPYVGFLHSGSDCHLPFVTSIFVWLHYPHPAQALVIAHAWLPSHVDILNVVMFWHCVSVSPFSLWGCHALWPIKLFLHSLSLRYISLLLLIVKVSLWGRWCHCHFTPES